MAKLKLNPEPTFRAKVLVPVAGAAPVAVDFSFKYRTRSELREFVKSLADLPEVVRTDPLRFQQIVFNLLSNAVKFTAEGRIVLRAAWMAPDRLDISVTDTGCGIPEDALQKIFTGSYEKIAAPVDGTRSNMGIGLSVCAAIVKAHGSDITAKNKSGGGAVFSFALEREGEDDGQ